MKCQSCSHDNRERRRFCSECASPLDALCPSCQAQYEPGERFCGECAASLPGNSGAATLARPRTDLRNPDSFSEVRYLVKKYLGEGKSKRVYLVHDSVLDRDVALALLKTDGIDESERGRILQEAQTMARMGEHPNVMPIYDLGFDGGVPFMVMPVMSGGSVDNLLRTSEQGGLALDQALPLALGVCDGLAFAHSRGIVHRDLKPGNVWLTSDQVPYAPRIGDFGLALSQSVNRMTSPDVVVGTPLYMSPEQIRGDELDQRTDLYSLGAMLYEMVAGTPPFSGDSPLAIIGQHLTTAPLAPTWYNKDCPRELESLIIRLLAKDREARPQSAADVLEALELIEASVSGAQTPGSHQRTGDALSPSSDSSFVGRDREMARLAAALEDSRAGRGHLAMVVGEPGSGRPAWPGSWRATRGCGAPG